MRFAYCPATGEEPGEVRATVRLNPPAAGESAPLRHVILDGEGRPLRLAGEDRSPVTEEIARVIPDDPEIQTRDGDECEWRWRFDAEKDAQGRLLLHMGKIAAALPGHSRYNGGGVKQIERIDKSKTDGWSLIGEYCPDRADWHRPGLYLDISKAGSRAHPNTNYQLFRLYADGTVACCGQASSAKHGKSWATSLWPAIERELEDARAFGGPFVPAVAEDPVPLETETGESAGDEDDATIRAFVRLMRRLPDREREYAYEAINAAVVSGTCVDCDGAGCEYCRGTGQMDDGGIVQLSAASA